MRTRVSIRMGDGLPSIENHTLSKIMDEVAREDTQGLIRKDLLLDIEDKNITLVKSDRHIQEVN